MNANILSESGKAARQNWQELTTTLNWWVWVKWAAYHLFAWIPASILIWGVVSVFGVGGPFLLEQLWIHGINDPYRYVGASVLTLFGPVVLARFLGSKNEDPSTAKVVNFALNGTRSPFTFVKDKTK